MHRLLRILIICFVFETGFSQELYFPRNIQKAIENGTRTTNGIPGENYWQNHGVYNLNIKVNPKTRMVMGKEAITYRNESPDTLKKLVFRFVNNIHKPNSPRGYYASDNFLDKGLTITSMKINEEKYEVDAHNWGTIGQVKLKEVLMPKSFVSMEIEWNYPLSKQSGREGQIDPSTFFVAYSYPRVSVYDDYNGWDILDHTGRQEFYNDFNDYTFTVTVPKNYIVYATGNLLNADEVLQREYAQRLEKSYQSDEIVHIANLSEMKSKKVTNQKSWNTWKFEAKNITDVCFALSDHYVWDASSVKVEDGRRVSIQAAYNDTAKDFKQYVKWARFSLDFFSNQWPGISFPFPKMTAFQGFADMEYPMMVNDGTEKDFRFARLLQDHEVLHSYFPFYMGINETRYAFMDEGWTTAFEYLVGIAEFGQESADEFFKSFRSKGYISNNSSENDQQMITQSSQQAGIGYGSNSYGKAALSYLALKDLMGDSAFKKALHFYMDTWKGKHPIPWDYFGCFNESYGKNLNWFFNNWFFSYHYIDLRINTMATSAGKINIDLENIGGFAIPFDIVLTTKEGHTIRRHFTPLVWKEHPKKLSIEIETNAIISKIEIDNGIYLDATPTDNLKALN